MRLLKSSALLFALVIAACGGGQKQDTLPEPETPVASGPETPRPVTPDAPRPVPVADVAAPTSPIYFDFDSFVVKDSSRPVLQQMAEYLQRNTKAHLTIAGHTDERGTTEYNLALGDQRAKAAHDYLIRLGVDPTRIKTISYGKEKPAIDGHDESAWSRNRRDEFNTVTR